MKKYIFELLAEKTTVFPEQVYHVYIESNKDKDEVIDLFKKTHRNMINSENKGKITIIKFPVGELVMLDSYDLVRCKLYTYNDGLRELFSEEEWATMGEPYDLDPQFVNYIESE